MDIDSVRAVPFGLLANELVTNAIKHAFPDRTGRVVLTVERAGDEIEFTVADNGVGLTDKGPARAAARHGADYVAIFVRQLGGTIDSVGAERSRDHRPNTASLAFGFAEDADCVTYSESRCNQARRLAKGDFPGGCDARVPPIWRPDMAFHFIKWAIDVGRHVGKVVLTRMLAQRIA